MKILVCGQLWPAEQLAICYRVPALSAMSHFYVTLPCDSSLSFFPNNTVAQYNTKLAERICLDGDYEVALVEMIYPLTFQNIWNEDESLYIELVQNEKVIFKYNLEAGHYDSESVFAKALSDNFAAALSRETSIKNVLVRFTFDENTRRIRMAIQCEAGITLYMSDALKTKLGFCKDGPYGRGWLWASETFDVRAGRRLMYVYCDVASFVPVGNTKSPLLRVCNVGGTYGEVVRVTFDRPFYIPVSRCEFDTILIDIRDELGQPMPFAFGKSVATLHFRRRHALLTSSS